MTRPMEPGYDSASPGKFDTFIPSARQINVPPEVNLIDAITAVILIEASLTSTQTIRTPIDLYAKEMDASDYADWFSAIESEILMKLEIEKAEYLEPIGMESVCESELEMEYSFNVESPMISKATQI